MGQHSSWDEAPSFRGSFGPGGSDGEASDKPSHRSLRSRKYDDGPGTVREFIPAWDGVDSTLRDYERKVGIFQRNTRLPKTKRAGKLLEQLTGKAFDFTETLDLDLLEHRDGVERLLAFLKSKYRPVQILHIGKTCDELLYGFARQPREEMVEYDNKFQATLRRVEQVAGFEVPPVLKAHMFLRKANLPSSVQSQIVSAAGGNYDYEALRDQVLAAVPRVSILERAGSSSQGAFYSGEGPRRHGGHERRPPRDKGRFQRSSSRFDKKPFRKHKAYETEAGATEASPGEAADAEGRPPSATDSSEGESEGDSSSDGEEGGSDSELEAAGQKAASGDCQGEKLLQARRGTQARARAQGQRQEDRGAQADHALPQVRENRTLASRLPRQRAEQASSLQQLSSTHSPCP